jgi:hypothetical protein
VQNGNGGGWLVEAGPAQNGPGGFGGGAGGPGGPGGFGAGFGGGGAMTFAGPDWNRPDPALVQYLEQQQGSAHYLVATTTSSYASLFILATREPPMALGGYQGWDRIVAPAQLAQMVSDGIVRFFYLPAPPGLPGSRQPSFAGGSLEGTSDLVNWVSSNCQIVQVGSTQSRTGQPLYDCAA